MASLLLGYAAGGYVDNNAAFYRSRPYYAGFVQDGWKISKRLTLDFGVRYDVQIPWKERYNELNSGFDFSSKNPVSDQIIANWNQLTAAYNGSHPNHPYGGYPTPPAVIYGGVLFAGKNGRPQRAYTRDWSNVQPRLGIAWQVASRTDIRTGAGVYYRQP
ncbi:MAG: TonB-dependent receptor, partial [Acidobacteriaceae bacterium]|nr:TonB-dependent receptor [Acidobacteriaceae bacterium]